MSSERRTTRTRGFSLGTEASEAIDNYADRNNMTKSMVVERAVLEYTKRERTARIEEKVDKILEQMDEGDAPSSGNECTHTQTQTQTMDERESDDSSSTPESDGGVAVADSPAGVPQATFDSLEDYSPDYPDDYEISRDALREAPQAVNDGLVINPDHVDYSELQSKGMLVAVKTAVCAGIIRYNYSGGITEEQIKRTASEVLGGGRNARRHFDAITQYLCERPTELEMLDEDNITDEPVPLQKKLCIEDGVYAPSKHYLLESYYGFYFADSVDKINTANEDGPSHKNRAVCNGVLSYLYGNRDQFIEYACDSRSDFIETYHRLVRESLKTQEVEDSDMSFPVIGSDNTASTVEEFEEIVE